MRVSPFPGDKGATGSAPLTPNQGQGEICFDLELDLTTDPILAHIHRRVAGKNGPFVVDFYENIPLTELSTGEILKWA